MRRTMIGWSVLVLALSTYLRSQVQSPTSDSQAMVLATKSVVAMTGGAAITDVMLTGNAASLFGSDAETGTVTLLAKGVNQSRLDFSFTSGKRAEVRNTSSGLPQGSWSGADGVSHPDALHNCWTEASWFFPAFTSLSGTDPNVVLTYVGQESWAAATVQHLRSYRYLPAKNAKTTALTKQLSTTDFYLDATSLLPVAITFNAHADDDSSVNIPVEIRLSNYQATNGITVPLHIQKYLNGGPIIDIAITSVVANPGLADSVFTIQ